MPTKGPEIGRRTHRFRTIAARVRARREPCCLCGLPIDYTLPAEHKRSFTVAHAHSVKTHPHLAEDPTNIRGAAHRDCNASAGVSNEPPALGLTSNGW